MAESESLAMNNIDAGTAISIEASNAAPQQLLAAAAAAARRRKAAAQHQEGMGAGDHPFSFGRKRALSAGGQGGGVASTGVSSVNAFGDSDDEGTGGDENDSDNGGPDFYYMDQDGGVAVEDDESAGASSGIGAAGSSGGAVDLFRLRQVKRHHQQQHVS